MKPINFLLSNNLFHDSLVRKTIQEYEQKKGSIFGAQVWFEGEKYVLVKDDYRELIQRSKILCENAENYIGVKNLELKL